MASMPIRVRRCADRGIFRDERGMTSVGMAVAIMISLALIFSGAQAFKVGTASSEIQEVADACSLAAENEVAEFMIAVKACDAAVLSMTLLSALSYGLGIVAACVPPLAEVSAELVEIGSKVSDERDRFSAAASRGLNDLQKLLPFLAAASSQSVAKANEGNAAMDASYYALSVLVPLEGDPIGSLPNDALEKLGCDVEENAQDIRDAAARAEELAEKANEQKLRAFNHDCGNNPGYCQYQRAATLSSISDADNPFYSNVDTWSFSAALERARKYYSARLATENCPNTSVADNASFNIRMKFYEYAKELLDTGYVNDDGSSFDAYFPKLPSNKQEMRSTPIWREAMFPVTGDVEGTDGIMHAYEGCPAADDIVLYDSVEALEAEIYIGCEVCGFGTESLGNVASASTNIENGFEYHYEQIRQAAVEYQNARSELDPLKEEVEGKVEPILESLDGLFGSLDSQRIHATPPGSAGAITIVVNTSVNSSDAGFESLFVPPGQLGARGAVSASSLVEDTGHDDSNVITSLLDGLGDNAAAGVSRIVLKCWSSLLSVYENGQQSLKDAVSGGLDLLPLGTGSGLGEWAAETIDSAFAACGIEPANLKAIKPALLNTEYVASAGKDSFTASFSQVKAGALAGSAPITDPFSSIVHVVGESIFNAPASQDMTIAEIEFPIGGSSIPISIALPPSVSESSAGVIKQCANAIGSMLGGEAKGSAWQ